MIQYIATTLSTLLLLAAHLPAQTQLPVTVTEQTLRANDEALFLYTFVEGDEIVLDLEVAKGRPIREVEVRAFPSTIRFQDFKTTRITGQRIRVPRTGVYLFRIDGGGGMGAKVCHLRISRIPASGQWRNFDTATQWRLSGDTLTVTRQERVLTSVDTSIVTVTDRSERVNALSNHFTGGNKMAFTVDLPKNRITPDATTEVASWAYWIGVGNEGREAYEVEKAKLLMGNLKTVATLVDPLAGLALGAYTILTSPPKGDNVLYHFTHTVGGKERDFVTGSSIVAHGRITDFLQGSFRVRLENDNYLDGINVNVKIVAALVHKTYGYRTFEEVGPRKL